MDRGFSELERKLETSGWEFELYEGFIKHVGGMWRRTVDGEVEYGFVAGADHENRNGVVHGGMLMTFVDRSFGFTARDTSGGKRSATVDLNTHFMKPMEIGQFASIRPSILQRTRTLVFVTGIVWCGGEPIVNAQGIWRISFSG